MTQTANLASFMVGCYENDAARVFEAIQDVLVEPHRSGLIPGFDAAKTAAISAGASAFSISGSGPTVFAFSHDEAVAHKIDVAICQAFQNAQVNCDSWVTYVGAPGATLVENFEP